MTMSPIQSWATMLLLIVLVILVTYILLRVQHSISLLIAQQQQRAEEQIDARLEQEYLDQLVRTPLGSVVQMNGSARFLVVMVTPNRVGLQDYWQDVYYELETADANERTTPVSLDSLTAHEQTLVHRAVRKYLMD